MLNKNRIKYHTLNQMVLDDEKLRHENWKRKRKAKNICITKIITK
jgi:hypothetical protein